MRAGGNRSEGRGTGIPVVRVPGWGRKAQKTLNGPRRRDELRWGREYHRPYREKGCTSTGVGRPDTGRSRGKGSTEPGL